MCRKSQPLVIFVCIDAHLEDTDHTISCAVLPTLHPVGLLSGGIYSFCETPEFIQEVPPELPTVKEVNNKLAKCHFFFGRRSVPLIDAGTVY